MIEIQLRIAELENRLHVLCNARRRSQRHNHSNEISEIEGEIKGLRWCLNHCFNISTPNVIEQ